MIFAADGRGGFVVPEFARTIDGIAAFVRLLGLVARTRLTLSQIDARIPVRRTCSGGPSRPRGRPRAA